MIRSKLSLGKILQINIFLRIRNVLPIFPLTFFIYFFVTYFLFYSFLFEFEFVFGRKKIPDFSFLFFLRMFRFEIKIFLRIFFLIRDL